MVFKIIFKGFSVLFFLFAIIVLFFASTPPIDIISGTVENVTTKDLVSIGMIIALATISISAGTVSKFFD